MDSLILNQKNIATTEKQHSLENRLYIEIQKRSQEKKYYIKSDQANYSYKNLLKTMHKLSSLFNDYKLSQGDKIVIITQYDQYALELFLSAICTGFCPIILSKDIKKHKINQLLSSIKPQLVFIDQSLDKQFKLENNKILIVPTKKLHFFKHKQIDKKTYPAILTETHSSDIPKRLDANQLAYILFTSGSTDNPKAVAHTYASLYTHLETLKKVYHHTEQSIIYNNLDLSHADGIIHGATLTAFIGATLIRNQSFSIHNLDNQLNSLSRYQVTHFITIPTILAWMDRFTQEDDYFSYKNFKYIISTAGELNQTLWDKLNQRFNLYICNIYGLTETVCGGIFNGPDISHTTDNIGTPIDIDTLIYDQQSNEYSKTGIGELLISGKSLFLQYYNNPKATSDCFINYSNKIWFKTGDLVKIDKTGTVKIIGRAKSVIISGGRNIYPNEVNEILLKHPNILECYTFAEKHEFHSENVATALIVNQKIEKQLIIEHCLEYLETYQVPKNIYYVNELPKGKSGKVIDSELQALLNPQNSLETEIIKISDNMIIDIAADTFQVSTSSLSLSDSTDTIDLWDSLGHLSFINKLEKQFNVKFNFQEIVNIKNLEDVKVLLESKP
ncbi:AMP-binding protein [Thiotrichales bacterium 19X7-9]|nr:AMP-binding protein [Thiotrichales bacterium 19X7-9]